MIVLIKPPVAVQIIFVSLQIMLPAAVKKIWFVGSDLQICYHIY